MKTHEDLYRALPGKSKGSTGAGRLPDETLAAAALGALLPAAML